MRNLRINSRASFSLEAMIVFIGVTLFWVAVFSAVSPQLKEMQERVVLEELKGECLKVTNTVDTLATYGAGSIYISMTPYFEQSMARGIFFCQEHIGCRCDKSGSPPREGCSKRIFAVKTNRTGEGAAARASCSAHVADWIDITSDGGRVVLCEDLEDGEGFGPGGNFTIQFGSYYEKPVIVGGLEKSVRDCWD